MRGSVGVIRNDQVSCEGVYAGTWMEYETGGTVHSFKAGDVVRMTDWHAFADAVILGFDSKGNAKLARPYAYASSTGTTCANPLLGCESIAYVSPEKLVEFWKKIGDGGYTT